MAEQEIYDPHQSKIDPDDQRLKLPKPRARRLKKGPAVALAFAVAGIIMFAITIALMPRDNKVAAAAEDVDPVAVRSSITLPDVIREAPDNNDPVSVVTARVPDYVPALGPKLPGDLGHSMVDPAVEPQNPKSNLHGGSQTPSLPSGAPNYGGGYSSGPSPEEKERQKALKASLFWSGGSGESELPEGRRLTGVNGPGDQVSKMLQGLQSQLPGGQGLSSLGSSSLSSGAAGSDPNMQGRKNSFLQTESGGENYVKNGVRWPKSVYEVKATSIIPVALVTGINTDLPGEIIGMVRENVYDTVTGNHLLIPQGSRLKAGYDSMIAYGQERVLLAWQRLIRPDGSSIDLETMPGADLSGYAGIKDKVDNHWLRIIGGVAISSFLSATATKSQGDNIGQDDLTVDQLFAQNVGQQINDVGQEITSKNINIQPTLTVPPGYTCNVLINKDMIIPPYDR